jgi:hypothetical protein
MEVFVQQLINGLTLGSIYGLIAIGYTMVFGILNMVNFAHQGVFLVSVFIALTALLVLQSWLGVSSIVLALMIIMVVSMALTSVLNWTIERVAYRPLRHSFRLAPLISSIGMSIFLTNFVQVTQGQRNKSIPPMFGKTITLIEGRGYDVAISYEQLTIWTVTALLLVVFWYLVSKTSLGRAQRACEQDQKMASLVGVNVNRRLRPRHQGLHRRRARRHRFAARRGDRRIDHRRDRNHVVVVLFHRLQGCGGFLRPCYHPDLPAAGPPRQAGRREGLTCQPRRPRRHPNLRPCAH